MQRYCEKKCIDQSCVGLSTPSTKMVFRTELKENEFAKLVDSNNHLVGFNDGVYDLDRYEFRPFNVNDVVTLSTRYDFPLETEHDLYEEISCIVSCRMERIRSPLFLDRCK